MSNQSFAHLNSYVFHKQSFIARCDNLKPSYLFATAKQSAIVWLILICSIWRIITEVFHLSKQVFLPEKRVFQEWKKILCNMSFTIRTVFHCKYCSFTAKRCLSEFVGLSDVIYVFHENNWLFVFHLQSGKWLSLSDQYRVNQRNVQIFHLTQSLQRSHRCLSNPQPLGSTVKTCLTPHTIVFQKWKTKNQEWLTAAERN